MKLKNINIFDIAECYIAGGAVLSTVTKQPVADYDIYSKTQEALVDICCNLLGEAQLVNLSDRAVTYKHYRETNESGERLLIQVIRGKFPTPESIFEKFDFTVCMGAFDCDSEKYVFHEDFWPDVASKTLRFNVNTLFPLNSLIRTYKYTQKGYKTSKTEMAKIALAAAKVGMPESWEELENQIGGTYGRSLKLAREGQEFSFEKAVEVLSEITDESFEGYTEDFQESFSEEELTAILEGSSGKMVVYRTPQPANLVFGVQEYVKVGEGKFLEAACVSDRLRDFGVELEVRDLTDIEYVSAWKQLKVTPKGYIGGVFTGNHNGVTYNPFQETRYESGQYLFAYLSKESVVKKKGYAICEVKIPTKDIKYVDSQKINTSSMICMNIEEF